MPLPVGRALAESLRVRCDVHLGAVRDRGHPPVEHPAVELGQREAATRGRMRGRVNEQRHGERDRADRERGGEASLPRRVHEPHRHRREPDRAEQHRASEQEAADGGGRRPPAQDQQRGAAGQREREERLREDVLLEHDLPAVQEHERRRRLRRGSG